MTAPSLLSLGERVEKAEAVRLTSFKFAYRVSDEAKRKMAAREEYSRRAALLYRDIVFK